MPVFETNVKFRIEAEKDSDIRSDVIQLLESEFAGNIIIEELGIAESGEDMLAPAARVATREEVLEYDVDPWELMPEQRFDCHIMLRSDIDACEARVNPAAGLLRIVRYDQEMVQDSADDELEKRNFCGGMWDKDGGRKIFYYLKC